MVYVIADTHFNHGNIIKYCNRPFKDANEMDETLIANWNSVVGKDDTVYHLGDFALAKTEQLQGYIRSLNGNIILLLGNHDRKAKSFWRSEGIQTYHQRRQLELDGVILSHAPVLFPDKLNIHGHTHKQATIILDKYYCVSVECTDYKPILLSEAISLGNKYISGQT